MDTRLRPQLYTRLLLLYIDDTFPIHFRKTGTMMNSNNIDSV